MIGFQIKVRIHARDFEPDMSCIEDIEDLMSAVESILALGYDDEETGESYSPNLIDAIRIERVHLF